MGKTRKSHTRIKSRKRIKQRKATKRRSRTKRSRRLTNLNRYYLGGAEGSEPSLSGSEPSAPDNEGPDTPDDEGRWFQIYHVRHVNNRFRNKSTRKINKPKKRNRKKR